MYRALTAIADLSGGEVALISGVKPGDFVKDQPNVWLGVAGYELAG